MKLNYDLPAYSAGATNAADSRAQTLPKAPPAYRPQPLPRVLQTRMAVNRPQPGKLERNPVTPAVYRPNPEPKVLQRKLAATSPKQPDVTRRGINVAPVRQPISGPLATTYNTLVQRKVTLGVGTVRPSRQAQAATSRIQPNRAHSRVIQRITGKEALSSFTTKQEEHDFYEWLSIHDVGVGLGKGEDTQFGYALILHDIKDVKELHAKIRLFKQRQLLAKSHTNKDEENIAKFLYDSLTKSMIINAYAKAKLTLEEVSSSLAFHSEKEFTALHIKSALSKNPGLLVNDVWNFKIRELRRIDQVFGFEHKGKINLRKGAADLHIAIHELLHKLSCEGLEDKLGPLLNEGMTERITNLVCKEVKAPTSDDYYPRQRELLVHVARFLKLSEHSIQYAYFRSPDTLVQKFVDEIGLAGYQGFVREKDPNQAATIFALEFKKQAVLKEKAAKEASVMDPAICKSQCLTRNIKFDDHRWKTSAAYREAKLKQVEDAKANKTIWGLIREVANGTEKYVQMGNLQPILGF